MQKLPIDNKLEVTKRSRKKIVIPKKNENESVVDTRVKDDDTRGTLRRANIAEVVRNQSRLASKSTNELNNYVDSDRNNTPIYAYSPKPVRPTFADQSVRKPVNLTSKHPTPNSKSRIYELNDDDDDAEFEELKFKDEPDGNFTKTFSFKIRLFFEFMFTRFS